MTRLEIVFLAIALLSIVTAITVILIYRWKTKKTLERMNSMLDSAISGTFRETMFDESLLSAVETRLSQYISSSAVSAQSLREEKDKIKALLGDISHQTKTPLSNILLYAQLLAERELPEESRICVAALNTQAEKMSFLIDALVKTSRLETGVFQLEPKLSNVQTMLDAAVAQISPNAQKKGLAVICGETDVKAFIDAKWTGEAIYNILDNAVKYTPERGKIEIKTTTYQLFCRIDIADTGMGIAEEEQEKVFQRFYRSQTVSDVQGVGIGLFLSRQIITAQGGYIKVSSCQGEGALFSVFLPIRP